MKFDIKLMRYSAKMSSAVLSTGAIAYAGYWGGLKLDHHLGSSPLCAIGLLLLGICLGLGWILFVASRAKF